MNKKIGEYEWERMGLERQLESISNGWLPPKKYKTYRKWERKYNKKGGGYLSSGTVYLMVDGHPNEIRRYKDRKVRQKFMDIFRYKVERVKHEHEIYILVKPDAPIEKTVKKSSKNRIPPPF